MTLPTWDIIQAAVLYCGFLAIVLWRLYFPWETGKTWKKSFNHFTLLYGLVTALYLFELVMFIITARKDFNASSKYSTVLQYGSSNATAQSVAMLHGEREWPIYWLRSMVLCVPVCVALVIFMAAFQSRKHMEEIRQDSAQMQHDRVINILAMPAVYAVVVMSGVARVYALAVDELIVDGGSEPWPDWAESKAISLADYETCLYVGDLYEAWALYQFGKLTMELLQNALPDAEEAGTSPSRGPSQRLSIQAIGQVLWVGTGIFIMVNLIQTGWVLYMWFFSYPSTHWLAFQDALIRFSYAGMVASAAAIYNVYIVESTFGHFIQGYAPFLKFLSVKILVFFTYWQAPFLAILRLIGIMHFTDVQMKLLQASLLVFECVFCAGLHIFAWGSQEPWFASVGEITPLLDQKLDKSP